MSRTGSHAKVSVSLANNRAACFRPHNREDRGFVMSVKQAGVMIELQVIVIAVESHSGTTTDGGSNPMRLFLAIVLFAVHSVACGISPCSH